MFCNILHCFGSLRDISPSFIDLCEAFRPAVPDIGQFRFSVRAGSQIDLSALCARFGLIIGPNPIHFPSFGQFRFSVRRREGGSVLSSPLISHSEGGSIRSYAFASFPSFGRSKPFSGGGEWIAEEGGGRARPNLMSRPILSRAWHLFLLRHAIFKRPRRWTISLFGPRRSRRGHAA